MSAAFDPETFLGILERIAGGYDPSSEEHASIVRAAKAILFIHATSQGDAFQAFIESSAEDLTDQQKKVLAAMGLE